VKRRLAGAVVLAASLAMAVSAGSSSRSSSSTSSSGKDDSVPSVDGKGKTITVWLRSDAQKGWPAVVEQASQRFEAAIGARSLSRWDACSW